MTHRAASALPNIGMAATMTKPTEPAPKPVKDRPQLSAEGLAGLKQQAAKMEENFDNLSSAFKSFDKARKGRINSKDFRYVTMFARSRSVRDHAGVEASF